MFYLIFGGILVFAGIYLIIKEIIAKTKGKHIPATMAGFSEERGNQYPLFQFNYEGQEYTISGAEPVKNPNTYKYHTGDTVNIVFLPSNTKYVDIEGSFTGFLWGLGAIAGGVVFILLYCRQNGII